MPTVNSDYLLNWVTYLCTLAAIAVPVVVLLLPAFIDPARNSSNAVAMLAWWMVMQALGFCATLFLMLARLVLK